MRLKMRKPIIMEVRENEEKWPTEKIEEIQQNLFEYLKDYRAENPGYTKHSVMGPAGKLLTILSASMFGENVDSYVGYIENIHKSQKRPLSPEVRERLRSATQALIELKQNASERYFLKIVRAVDYGVYYLKMKEIAKAVEEKKAREEEKNAESGQK